jgi:hypothetical protein
MGAPCNIDSGDGGDGDGKSFLIASFKAGAPRNTKSHLPRRAEWTGSIHSDDNIGDGGDDECTDMTSSRRRSFRSLRLLPTPTTPATRATPPSTIMGDAAGIFASPPVC